MQKRIIFTVSYHLNEHDVKFVEGKVGIYFIFSKNLKIEYPFQSSGLLYIGMSESRQNSIAKRLRGHLTGQSGNLGVSNYAKKHDVMFTYHSASVLKEYSGGDLRDIEASFLWNFQDTHGCLPICNGQDGRKLDDESKRMAACVDWDFFQ